MLLFGLLSNLRHNALSQSFTLLLTEARALPSTARALRKRPLLPRRLGRCFANAGMEVLSTKKTALAPGTVLVFSNYTPIRLTLLRDARVFRYNTLLSRRRGRSHSEDSSSTLTCNCAAVLGASCNYLVYPETNFTVNAQH